jgi:mRNA-degrading endonuclease RelE of RelBE toxin-antitoxin system
MAYQILITADAEQDLNALHAHDRKTVLDAIALHLAQQPKQVSRSRIKQLVPPAISQYRLRVGDYRVYYDVDEPAQNVVVVQVYDKGRGPTPGGAKP